jgi:hypothetical protein
MQQATIIQATRRLSGSVKLRSILVFAVAVTVLTAVWANSYPSPSATPTASYAAMPPNRIFADEAAFVPDAATYANLAVGEDYLPLPEARAAIQAPTQPQNRIFADEAAFVPDAATYANLAVGEDYLPLTRPVAHTVQPIRMPRSLFFRDELAGASHPQPVIDAIATLFIERMVPLNGPR